MSEKRKQRRFPRRHQVRYGEADFTQVGFTADVSTTGMFIVGGRPKLDARIHIEMQVDATQKLYFEARVVRLIDVPPALRQIRKAGFGCRFLTSTELLADILPKGMPLLPNLAPAAPDLELTYETLEAFNTAYEREFVRGGAFAWGTSTFAVNAVVQLKVTATWSQRSVILEAQVVNLVPGPDGRTGVAVMFKNLQVAVQDLKTLTTAQ